MTMFGDDSLFAEFEKERDAPDRILLGKLQGKNKTNGSNAVNGSSNVETNDQDGDAVNETDAGFETETTDPQSSGTNFGLGRPITHTQLDEVHELKKEVEKLTAENVLLRQQLRLTASQKYFIDDNSPFLQVLFMNNKIARQYRKDIEVFVAELVEKYHRNKTLNFPSLPHKPSAVYTGSLDDDNLPADSPHYVIGCSQFYEDFLLDSLGWPLVAFNPSLTDGWEIPVYSQVYKEALPAEEEDEKPTKKRSRQTASCFNCGGDHVLSKCTLPKDMARISKSRNEYMANSPSTSQANQSRYHVTDPRFSAFRPGQISDDLRRALGINSQQLPPHIYQMRRLGYPPGHLEESLMQTSGLAVFDKHGKETDMKGQSLEDGEVNESRLEPSGLYDEKRIVRFAGFNAPMPTGVVDEHQMYGLPPFNMHVAQSTIQHMMDSTPNAQNKRKSMEPHLASGGKRRRLSGSDMELSDSEGATSQPDANDQHVAPETAGPSTNKKAINRALSKVSSREDGEWSDSDADAGQERRQSSDSGPPSPGSMVVLDSVGTDSPAPPLPIFSPPAQPPPPPDSPSVSTTTTPGPSHKKTDQSGSFVTPVNSRLPIQTTPSTGGSIKMNLGTPLAFDSPGSVSKDNAKQGKGLPDACKFALGIQEHLNFDNLPGATGSYMKLRDVIKSKKDTPKSGSKS